MTPSILLIEDDNTTRLSMTAWLHSAGFHVIQAADAAHGLDAFLHNTPDLVLLDLGLYGRGEGDGMDVLRRIKATRPAVPVIIVSARTHISDAIDAFKAGAWDYIVKPIVSTSVFINTLRNCLAQVQLQQRVHEIQDHLYQLIENLPVIIFIINANLEFEFLNQSTQPILGYAPQDILQSPRSFLRYIVAEDRGKFLHTLRSCFRLHSPPFCLDFRFIHKDGYQIFLQAQSITGFKDEEHFPDRLEGMITDVTRYSYLDNLLVQNEKLNLLSTMTEEVAHEIRNPLVSLGGCARKLRSVYPESTETEVILQECTRLERLVQRITAYQEPLTVTWEYCSVSAAVALALRLLSRRIGRKGLRCDVRNADLCPAVWADQELVHRIFMTLIAQAVEVACDQGRMYIEARHSHDAVYIDITIKSVCGHVPEHYAQLSPFGEKGNSSLSLCYKLLKHIHGHLHVQQNGELARMSVTLLKHQLSLQQAQETAAALS